MEMNLTDQNITVVLGGLSYNGKFVGDSSFRDKCIVCVNLNGQQTQLEVERRFLTFQHLNCPICQSSNVHSRDCGYTTFNPNWTECDDCKFRCNGNVHCWNHIVTTLNSTDPIDTELQKWSNALARLAGLEKIKEMVQKFHHSF